MLQYKKLLSFKIFKSFLLIFLLVACYLLFVTSNVSAQNKCGINIGDHYQEVTSVSQMAKNGGWIVALGTLGNCSNFESLFGRGLNVVIRAYKGGEKFTSDDATAWVASLGKLNTSGQKVYFMPWNEPNDPGECGQGTACSPEEVVNYVNDLKSKLSSAGLLNNKVVLLSPMLDTHNPNYQSYKSSYSDKNALNEYDSAVSGSYIPCQSGYANENNCRYKEVAPPQYFAVESGVTNTCGQPWPCYKDQEITTMLNKAYSQYWKNDPAFSMFAIFSYDPMDKSQTRNSWNIYSAPGVNNFYSTSCTPGTVYSGNMDQNKFDDWFKKNSADLVSCGGCGYGTKAFGCTASSAPPEGNNSQCMTVIKPEEVGTSRPFECYICSKNIQNPISSCAQTPILKSSVSYSWKDRDVSCDGNSYAQEDWGGAVTVDPTQVDIPFVGKKGAEDEKEYLADYFEGTGYYYSPPYNFESRLDQERVINEGGVWRKLAPQKIQDQYKKNLVYRAIDSLANKTSVPIHNYTISYENESAYLVDFFYHFPPEEKNFPTQKEYDEAYNSWKITKWGRLWPAVPMFSREDSNGRVNLSLQTPYKNFDIQKPADPEKDPQILKVPHVARLYEAASAVQNLLLPKQIQTSASLPSVIARSETTKQSPNLLASSTIVSPNSNVITSQKLSHSKIPLSAGQSLSNSSNSTENSALQNSKSSEALSVTKGVDDLLVSSTLASPNSPLARRSPKDKGGILLAQANPQNNCPVYINSDGAGNFKAYPNLGDNDCYWRDTQGTYSCDGMTAPFDADKFRQLAFNAPIEFQCPSNTKSVSFYIGSAGRMGPEKCDWIPQNQFGCTCSIITNSNGQTTTSCASAPPPPPPCGTNKSGVDMCEKESITGSGDKLCCDPVTAKFTAYDQFRTPDKPAGCNTGKEPECSESKGADVERKLRVGITLPLLGEIWKKTTDTASGVFNLFRPSDISEFEDLDARSQANVVYTASNVQGTNPLSIDPGSGEFYYPHLGGIEESKEWMTNCLLVPIKTGNPVCQKYGYSPTSGSHLTYVEGSNKVAWCKANCEKRRGTDDCPVLDYKIDFRNPDDTIPNLESLIKAIEAGYKQSPVSKTTSSGERYIDMVVRRAIENGWSPSFLIALWLEETGASQTVVAGSSVDAFGCYPYTDEKKTLEESLNCFFKNFNVETDFERFMLRYSSLMDRDLCQCFCLNPNFPGNIEVEYNFVKNPQ